MAKSRRNRPVNRVTPRPLNDSENIAKVVREEVASAISKALALPAGAQATEMTPSYLQQLQMRGTSNISGQTALPRDPYNNIMFGPGEPLYPAPISPLLPSGRPAPRQWEFPVSWNLQTTTTRSVPWTILRDAADNVSIVRSCIETCKSALTGLDWNFGIDASRARALAKHSNTSSHQVIADLQDKFADDIDQLHQWWRYPMRGVTFTEWLNAILEDEMVLDAIALYPRFSLGGDLLAMEYVDPSTIKPILDDRGSTPVPPLCAYQQILWGFPRGDYSASPAEEVDGEYSEAVYGPLIVNGARTDTLIYKVRNKRTRGPYGLSCVEQALPDIDLWLKRWEWLRSEFDSGVTPEMIIKATGMNISPEQRLQWQAVFNDDLSGNTADRHRATVLPDGFDPVFPGSFDAKFNSDFDLHLIRLICAAFDVLPTSLGFVQSGRSGSMGSSSGGRGQQQGEQDAQLQRGTKPRAKWISEIINEISRNYLGMPPEVSFSFTGIDDQDEQKEATLLEGYVNNGLMVLNEGRDRLNLPRFAIEQANEPFIATPTGPAFFNPEVQPVGMPGNLPSAQQNNPTQQNAPQQPAIEAPTAEAPRDEQVQGTPDKQTDQKALRAEQRAFFKFARNTSTRDTPWRDFTFKSYSPSVGEAANRLAAAGDVDAVKALFELHDGA